MVACGSCQGLLLFGLTGKNTVFELYFFGSDGLSGCGAVFLGIEGAVLGEVSGLWELIFEVIVFPFGGGVRVDGVL